MYFRLRMTRRSNSSFFPIIKMAKKIMTKSFWQKFLIESCLSRIFFEFQVGTTMVDDIESGLIRDSF